MKKLITAKMIASLKARGETKIFIDDNTLITPSARDAIRNWNIEVIKGEDCLSKGTHKDINSVNTACKCQDTDISITRQEIVEIIIKILNERGLIR